MRELRLIAMSDDGTHLVLRGDDDETPMSLPLDERLHAALRGDRARLGQLEIQMDSQIRPRDIQARVRSGQTPEAVAALANMPLDRVLRFAGPVLAERQHVAERAQAAVIRRAADTPNRPLQETVGEWVSSYDVDPESIEWDAWRRDDGRWIVSAAWQVQQDERQALFTFDPAGRSVLAENDEARVVAKEQAPEQPAQPPEPAAIAPVAPSSSTTAAPSPGPARLSVVGPADDGAPTTDVLDDADTQPTAPVPLAHRRTKERAGAKEATGDEQPDPWAAEEPSSDRLRLADIAGQIEGDDDDPQPEAERVAASVAASGLQPAKRSSRSKRPSVPSWDEIMFGRRDKSK